METSTGDLHNTLLTVIPHLVQQSFSWGDTWEIIVFILLLLGSGFVSSAETAFFSITPPQLMELKNAKHSSGRLIFHLLSTPKRLLATLLILVNFINIAIIVLSSVLMTQFFDFSASPILGFVIQVAVVTFIIVMICEVLPKVYATQNALLVSNISVFPVFVADKILRPFSALLVLSTSFIDRRLGQKGYDISVEELTHAIDITSDINTPEEEKKILKGIARFGNTDVKQIMKPRMDVIAFDKQTKFPDVLAIIRENGYSRIPVFDKTFDHVTGILYIKDLIAFLDKEHEENFNWELLIRPAYFVPESKKINDLLQEFQEKKMHLAIVVDEYGGSSGIVTLEDILEEIVGEISDEFDDDELAYSKLDDRTFIFEGKTLLNDMSRVMGVDRKLFDMCKDEIDSLAGLILEMTGRLPAKNEVVRFNDIVFTIESADKRRIKRVKIEIPETKKEDEIENNEEGIIKNE